MWFALVWIAIYTLGNSLANPLSDMIGIEMSAHAVFCLVLTFALFFWIRKNGLMKKYGLCKTSVPARRFLWYVPLVLIASHNLWNGAAMNFEWAGLLSYIVFMLCVGFLEEVLLRGLLFRALQKDNVKTAIIISSVTFGLGHLIHLINGSGAELFENLLQVVGAVAVGFLFVTIFYRGGSLLPCIITHSAIDVISAFANESGLTPEKRILFFSIHTAIVIIYALILMKTLPKREPETSA